MATFWCISQESSSCLSSTNPKRGQSNCSHLGILWLVESTRWILEAHPPWMPATWTWHNWAHSLLQSGTGHQRSLSYPTWFVSNSQFRTWASCLGSRSPTSPIHWTSRYWRRPGQHSIHVTQNTHWRLDQAILSGSWWLQAGYDWANCLPRNDSNHLDLFRRSLSRGTCLSWCTSSAMATLPRPLLRCPGFSGNCHQQRAPIQQQDHLCHAK